MAVEALTRSDTGEVRLPASRQDWTAWVAATRTRAWCVRDPILDWLDAYGEQNGFCRDDKLPGYDPRTDIGPFLFEKGQAFEAAVVAHLATRVQVTRIAAGPEDIRSLDAAERTFDAMRAGIPIIHQGVLRDAENRTYGAPDLLVRSDVLRTLFPSALDDEAAHTPAPDLGRPDWHYRVVDIKFTTLHFTAKNELSQSGSAPAYCAQVALYNRALGRLQGMMPPVAYLLGRGWEQTVAGEKVRGTRCTDRLAEVWTAVHFAQADAACQWIHRVRADGSRWKATPEPSVHELRPNMSHSEDGPWHAAKRLIATEQGELTQVWQVGCERRDKAVAAGVTRWTDPRATPELLGVNGPATRPKLDALLAVNRSQEGPPVRPARIEADRDAWRPTPPLEFYVDFETVTDLDDDFSRIPERGGQTLIFMVGCGHIEDGEWRFRSFTTDELSEPEEARILAEWLDHMETVRKRLAPDDPAPRVLHWSRAEVSFLSTAFNSAVARHPERSWPEPNWYDLLQRVVRAEPVVVRGALGFGLKAVARALHAHGLIETVWQDGPADGLGAMVGAWRCAAQARSEGKRLMDYDLMRSIADYNEVDCKTMREVLAYLRAAH